MTAYFTTDAFLESGESSNSHISNNINITT